MIDSTLPILEGIMLESSREILIVGETKCLVYEMRPSTIDLLSNTGFHSSKADFDRRVFGGRCPRFVKDHIVTLFAMSMVSADLNL